MSATAVLVIVIAAGEARAPVTEALLATAAAALPAEITLRVAPVADPSGVDLVRIERELAAGAVVAVSWQTAPAGARASLRLHVARTDHWTVRAIDFSPADSASERGRTLGFAIASMWPEHVPGTARGERPPPATVAPNAGSSPPRERIGSETPAGSAPSEPPAALAGQEAAAPLPPPGPVAAGIGAVGSTGLGGTAAGVGGNVEILWRRFGSVWLRGGLALREGPLPELPGNDWLASLALGGEWWPRALAMGRRWHLGVRADLLALGHVIHRTAATDPESTPAETQVRLLPGLDATVRSMLRLSPRLDLTFGVGIEVAAGRTDLRVGENRMTRATLAPARGIADLGLRLSL